jgi:hypothetical protein
VTRELFRTEIAPTKRGAALAKKEREEKRAAARYFFSFASVRGLFEKRATLVDEKGHYKK